NNIEGEETEGFQTLNGFLTWLIGRVPTQGEIMTYQCWRFEILHVKSNRIVQVKVTTVE
ncbi:transporter associated domain-containing protein, partial [Vibrio rotiferianus]